MYPLPYGRKKLHVQPTLHKRPVRKYTQLSLSRNVQDEITVNDSSEADNLKRQDFNENFIP